MDKIREDYKDAYHQGGGNYYDVIIYQILNKYNGKKWIGDTFDLDVTKYAQFFMLKKGTHPSKEFIDDYNKYGEDAFIFSVLDIVQEIKYVRNRYKEYIEFEKPEYNLNQSYAV